MRRRCWRTCVSVERRASAISTGDRARGLRSRSRLRRPRPLWHATALFRVAPRWACVRDLDGPARRRGYARRRPLGVVTSLVLGYAPAPATALANVRQVEPGHVVELTQKARSVAYYTPSGRVAWRSMASAARALDRALTQAVERAPAQGRVGAFLSGGLDSSLILARLERSATRSRRTRSTSGRLPSEIRYAEAAARHLRVRHHVLNLSARRSATRSSPRCSTSKTPLRAHRRARLPARARGRQDARRGVTGEGGDPVFGGPKNVGMVLERAYGARRLGAAYLSAHHHLADDLDIALTPEWRRAFDDEALQRDIEQRIGPRGRGETFVGQLMVTNLAMKGGSNILVKVSKMVGAHGLALRSPLFDARVVELGRASRRGTSSTKPTRRSRSNEPWRGRSPRRSSTGRNAACPCHFARGSMARSARSPETCSPRGA